MDPLLLARLQFATTSSVHFLFVLVSLGLVTLLVYLQTAWMITGKGRYEQLTRYWGTLYLINYALGIGSGLIMEFQFGLNWSGLSHYVGNVFGAPLALETLVAFFLESTFLGMWIFGWHRLRKGIHLALIWGVAITAYLSAFWIMVANAWLQNPVGYRVDPAGAAGDRPAAHLTDFGALLSNPTLIHAVPHVLGAALMTGGFLMAGISAARLVRRTEEVEAFRTSLRLGLITGALGSVITLGTGFAKFAVLAELQPGKIGDQAGQARLAEEWTRQHGPGDYLTPEWIGLPLTVMLLIGFLLVGSVLLLPLCYRDRIVKFRFLLHLLRFMIPLPFIAAITGWLFREVGRQPWAAYGLLPVDAAVSPVSAPVMLASFLGFTTILVALTVANWVLLARHAGRGAADPALGRAPTRPTGDPTESQSDPVFA